MTEIVNYSLRLQMSPSTIDTEPRLDVDTHMAGSAYLEPTSRAWVADCRDSHTCMESRKMILMNLFAGQEWRHRHREQTCGHSRGRRGRDELRE